MSEEKQDERQARDKSTDAATRRERQAAALRENLRRRKAQKLAREDRGASPAGRDGRN